jgi:hypothetical protein
MMFFHTSHHGVHRARLTYAGRPQWPVTLQGCHPGCIRRPGGPCGGRCYSGWPNISLERPPYKYFCIFFVLTVLCLIYSRNSTSGVSGDTRLSSHGCVRYRPRWASDGPRWAVIVLHRHLRATSILNIFKIFFRNYLIRVWKFTALDLQPQRAPIKISGR